MNEVLSEVEVANLLNCAVTTIGECARDNRLPAIKFGKCWMFPRNALMEHINIVAMENLKKETVKTTGVFALVSKNKTPPVLPNFNN